MDPKRIVSKYLTIVYLLGVVNISIYVTISLTCSTLIVTALTFIFCIVMSKVTSAFLAKKVLFSVLSSELNPQKFHEIISDKRLNPTAHYQIASALSLGEYQLAVDIIVSKMSKPNCSIAVKYHYLSTLARIYFELRDKDKLKAIVEKRDEYIETSPNLYKGNLVDLYWTFYSHYVDGKFHDCKEDCNEILSFIGSNDSSYDLKKMNADFHFAVALFDNNEKTMAKESFEIITANAPKMQLATVSQIYIENINESNEAQLFNLNIVPKYNVAYVYENDSSPIQKNKTIILLSILFVVYLITQSLQ